MRNLKLMEDRSLQVECMCEVRELIRTNHICDSQSIQFVSNLFHLTVKQQRASESDRKNQSDRTNYAKSKLLVLKRASAGGDEAESTDCEEEEREVGTVDGRAAIDGGVGSVLCSVPQRTVFTHCTTISIDELATHRTSLRSDRAAFS
jgi:hypothetical protein